jgi:predicted PurR-regulated permease PerM
MGPRSSAADSPGVPMSDIAPRPFPAPPPAPEPEPAPPPPPPGVPRWAVIGIFILLSIAALAYAKSFLMPVVLAILLKLVFSPVQRALDRVGIPTSLSALLIVFALLSAVVTAILVLATPVSDWANRAPMFGRQIEAKLGELAWATEGMREAAKQMEEITSGEEDPEVQRVVIDDGGDLVALAVTVPAAIAQIFFTLILLFFLLASGDMFYEKIVHVMPTFSDKRRAMRIAHDIERKLSHYLSTITFINAGLGLAVGTAMWLLGMPNPILFGVLAFALNFIPYVGAIVGVALAMVVALVSLPLAYDALVVGAVYFLLTTIEGQLVTPHLVGRRLRLNTVVVFISITLFAWLWSVVGMLVAMPLLLTLRTLCEHIPALQPVGDFLSARGAERERANGDDAEPAA